MTRYSMTRRLFFILLLLGMIPRMQAQSLTLKKGILQDSIPVPELASESFSIFLPSNFDGEGKWPLLMVFDMQGKSKQAMYMFLEAAETHGFILAGSNAVSDTLAVTDNIQVVNRMLSGVQNMLPVNSQRMYTAGFGSGGKMAALVPVFIKAIRGVISCGATLPNSDLLSTQNRFHYVGLVGEEDFNFTAMSSARGILNTLRYPNELLVFKGGNHWPDAEWLDRALRFMILAEIAMGDLPKDPEFIQTGLEVDLDRYHNLYKSGALLRADRFISDLIRVYRPLADIDSLKSLRKTLRKNKQFKTQNRQFSNYQFRESLLKEDYAYYMDEDILSYNYNNLGWWQFQIDKLKEFINSPIRQESLMGKRLNGYVNALVEDNITLAEEEADKEGQLLLWMLKTITDPTDSGYYLKVIQESARIEDFGTALFYLEELLKKDYKDTKSLNSLEHTGLLRIMPEYKELIDKYLTSPPEPENEE